MKSRGNPTDFPVWKYYVGWYKLQTPVAPPLKRVEDRIRTLCEQLLTAEETEFQSLAVELRSAITQHIERIRARLAQYPLADERRSTDTAELTDDEPTTQPLFEIWKKRLREDCEREDKLRAYGSLGEECLRILWEERTEPSVQGVIEGRGPKA